jgi:hypothetical protein
MYIKKGDEEPRTFVDGYFVNGVACGKQTKVYFVDGTVLYEGDAKNGHPCRRGIRNWPDATYEGEFGENGLPSGSGVVKTLDGTSVAGTFLNGMLARPMLATEWLDGSIFRIVAQGGRILEEMLRSKEGFHNIVVARTARALCHKTALHVAVEAGNLGSVIMLVQKGACDPFQKDLAGRTAKDSAVWARKPRASHFLSFLEVASGARNGASRKTNKR